MNIADILKAALTPGSPLNRKGLIWRSRRALAQIAGVPEAEVLECLLGDLAQVVTCRASKKADLGVLVALTMNIPPPEGQDVAAPPLAGDANNHYYEAEEDGVEDGVEAPMDIFVEVDEQDAIAGAAMAAHNAAQAVGAAADEE